MVNFYPEFDCEPVKDYRALILLDCSRSMSKIEGGETSLHHVAKRVSYCTFYMLYTRSTMMSDFKMLLTLQVDPEF